MRKLNSLKCNKKVGGCGREGEWRVTLDSIAKRIIIDCIHCEYRHSLPLDCEALIKDPMFYLQEFDETGKEVIA